MAAPDNGVRIRFISSSDPYSSLKEGDEGTVAMTDDLGTIHVDWDNGFTLGLIPGEDRYRIL